MKDQVNELLKNPVVYGLSVILRLGLVVGFLFFFLVALAIMGDGFKAIGGKGGGSLFSFVDDPVAGLMVGILATVLVQSSSTSTSIVVAAVGANVLTVQQGVPVVMGANIGTSVTNTIVSLGFAGDHTNYERAFSGATVHDMFNLLGVLVFLPLDSIWNAINSGNGGFFFMLTDAILPAQTEANEELVTTLGIKASTAIFSKAVIDINKDIINDYSFGRPELSICGTLDAAGEEIDYYKLTEKKACGDSLLPLPLLQGNYTGEYTYDGSNYECQCGDYIDDYAGLAALAEASAYTGFNTLAGALEDEKCKGGKLKFDFCPTKYATGFPTFEADFGINQTVYSERVLTSVQTFWDETRVVKGGGLFENGLGDVEVGIVSLIISILILIVCLVGIVKTMQSLIQGPAEKWVVKALNYNFTGGGYVAIVVGAGITLLVQSSSITTSILTPMVAIGTLSLENMFPFTVGANLGTTGTGLIAGLSNGGRTSIQIALCHTFFNIINTLVWYPVPFMRNIPLSGARFLGTMAAAYRLFPIFYIIIVFVLYPLFLLAISALSNDGGAGATAGAVLLGILFGGSHLFFLYWYHRMGGKDKVSESVNSKAEANKAKTEAAKVEKAENVAV